MLHHIEYEKTLSLHPQEDTGGRPGENKDGEIIHVYRRTVVQNVQAILGAKARFEHL